MSWPQPEAMAHLLQYDTSHGRFSKKDYSRSGAPVLFTISMASFDPVRILHLADIELLPWKDLNIDIVLDCTGVYGSHSDGQKHIEAGAKKVLFFTSGGRQILITPLSMV